MRLPSSVCLISLLLATPGSIVAQAASANSSALARGESKETHVFQIAAGDASESLVLLSRQAGTAVVFVVEHVRGIRTNAVEGRFSTRDALERLLANTPLIVVEDRRTGALVIKRGRPQASPPQPPPPKPNRPSEPSVKSSHSTPRAGWLAALLSLVQAPSPAAQPRPADDAANVNTTDVVQMMTYRVTAASEGGYYSASALTGTRTQTPLAELPMTVNVVTSELIADLGAVRLEETLLYTPGVRKGSDFESNLTMRGFLNETPRFNGFATRNTSRWDSAIIERVEVLKGPSAALNGSTATAGGFVNVISKKPLFQARHELTLSATSDERYRAALDLTGPIAPGGRGAKFAYRVIGVVQDGAGNAWRDFSHGHRAVVSPSLTWRPTTSTEVTVELYRDRYNRGMDVVVHPLMGNDQSKLYLDRVSPKFNINGPGGFDKFRMDGAFLYATSQLSQDWTLRLVSAAFRSRTNFLRRQGFNERPNAPGMLATFGLNREPSLDSVWHRLDAQWQKDTAAGKLTLLLGVQHRNDTEGNTNRQDTTEAPFPLFNYTAANFVYKPLATYNWRLNADTDTRGWLLNGIASYKMLGDRLILFGGYSHLKNGEGRFINYLAGQNGATAPWDKVTDPDDYQFGATVRLTPKLNAYALYSSDVRLNVFDNAGVRLPNQTQDMVEAGLKLNVSSRLNGSIALFDIERDNLAQRDTSQPSQPITPSGTERSRGLELELYATPLENLDVIVGYTALDAKITSNRERPDLVGSALPEAPRHSASSWLRYRVPRGPARGLALGVGLVVSGESHPFGSETAQRRAFAIAPSYTLVNAMARYSFRLRGGTELNAQLGLNNLTDEMYLSGQDFGAPFGAELRLNYRF